MPLIQSRGVTVRFVNRTGVDKAIKSNTNPDGSAKDPLNVPGKLMELHQTLSAVGAQNKSTTAANDMYFDLRKDETKQAPEWVLLDWGYHAHKLAAQNGGPGIIEIRAQEPVDMRASAAMIPKGSPPPPESIEFGKAQTTPAAALEGVPEDDANKSKGSRSSKA